jgi:tellurite resistance protein TehA-like permease
MIGHRLLRARATTGTRTPLDGYPAVMATGIVSIAAAEQHFPVLALLLGVLAAAVFLLLSIRVGMRLRRRGVLLRDPDAALRSFSFVAACAVLAARWHSDSPLLAWTLGIVAAGAWVILAMNALIALHRHPRVELRRHARGAWLLASVACQALAITTANLADRASPALLLDIALAFWTLGLASYVALATLILGRALADRCPPQTPDSWILMGALAIATLAASTIAEAGGAPHHTELTTTLTRHAMTALWVLASASIPALVATQARRLIPSLHQHPARWAAVFPLGMYSVTTANLTPDLHGTALHVIAIIFFWIALAAWTLCAAGLTLHIPGRSHGRVSSTVVSGRGPTLSPRTRKGPRDDRH